MKLLDVPVIFFLAHWDFNVDESALCSIDSTSLIELNIIIVKYLAGFEHFINTRKYATLLVSNAVKEN